MISAIVLLMTFTEWMVYGLPLKGRNRTIQYELHGRETLENTISVSAAQLSQVFFIEIALGSTKDRLHTVIDTGSSNLWVPGAHIQFTALDNMLDVDHVRLAGSYNYHLSQTIEQSEVAYHVEYMDKTSADGFWARDSLVLGDTEVPNTVFGVATQRTGWSTMGVMGLGPSGCDIVNYDSTCAYNVPEMMKLQGKIDVVSYAVQLDPSLTSKGSIVFGGYDERKFLGQTLQEVRFLENTDHMRTKMSFGINGKQIALDMDTLMDTGSVVLAFPKQVISHMVQGLEYEKYGANYVLTVNENLRTFQDLGVFDFEFTDTVSGIPLLVKIPVYYFLKKVDIGAGTLRYALVITELQKDQLTLNVGFFKGTTVYYNFEKNTMAIAQDPDTVCLASHIESQLAKRDVPQSCSFNLSSFFSDAMPIHLDILKHSGHSEPNFRNHSTTHLPWTRS